MPSRRLPDRNSVWTAGGARVVLGEWRRSGDSITAFARGIGVSPQRLFGWRKRLGMTSKAVAPTAISLVPAMQVPAEPDPAGIIIRLPSGIAIEAGSSSPSWIASVVAELTRALP
ncbi:MAG: hypothetical protein H0W42_11220 [Gemmatimonadaceae bacterium]|nr:hypothetical protein [Gemmatimonadaceae bacterium]